MCQAEAWRTTAKAVYKTMKKFIEFIREQGVPGLAVGFILGGAVGVHHHVARVTGDRCMAEEVPAAIERLLRDRARFEDKTVSRFAARILEAWARENT